MCTGLINEWMDERTDGRMDGWMEGWMDQLKYFLWIWMGLIGSHQSNELAHRTEKGNNFQWVNRNQLVIFNGSIQWPLAADQSVLRSFVFVGLLINNRFSNWSDREIQVKSWKWHRIIHWIRLLFQWIIEKWRFEWIQTPFVDWIQLGRVSSLRTKLNPSRNSF